MRSITKGSPPESLRAYARHDDAYWDGYANKDEARTALCGEQGYLCAYCMKRILPERDEKQHLRMKIEHWAARSTHPELQLDWDNLLGVCRGGGPRRDDSHCDKRRENARLHIHPARKTPRPEDVFAYPADGRIQGKTEEAEADLRTLGLNLPALRRNRKAVFELLRRRLPRRGDWTASKIDAELKRWTTPSRDGKLPEYAGVAIHFLSRRLLRAQARLPQP